MLKLYTWKTPNGRKASIMLEELGVDYAIMPVDFSKKAQFEPAFLAISPNNKIPAIVDEDAPGGPISVFESGAVLNYLADKYERFLAPSGAGRYSALAWVYWQVGGLGPMLGQLGFFAMMSQEKVPLAIDRFTEEVERLIGVMDRRLSEAPYLGGEDYSIADIANYPWMSAAAEMMKPVLGPAVDRAENVRRWLKEVGARPAVQRGMAVPA